METFIHADVNDDAVRNYLTTYTDELDDSEDTFEEYTNVGFVQIDITDYQKGNSDYLPFTEGEIFLGYVGDDGVARLNVIETGGKLYAQKALRPMVSPFTEVSVSDTRIRKMYNVKRHAISGNIFTHTLKLSKASVVPSKTLPEFGLTDYATH